MGKLAFISYRRTDAPQAGHSVYAQLTARFGRGQFFMDVSAISPSTRWPDRIRLALQEATVMLVVIGPGWLTAADGYGRRRIDIETDWVRTEVSFALTNHVPIMPVLVAGVQSVPAAEALNESIKELANFQAIALRDETWETDLNLLARALVEKFDFIENEKPPVLPRPEVRVPPLTEKELDEALRTLPGWEPVESSVPGDYPNSRRELRKDYRFRSFAKAIAFMSEAVTPINKMVHHPRWQNQWRTVTVWLSTWDIKNKISKLDIELARTLDRLYLELQQRKPEGTKGSGQS
jgi:pterin-4a-carbinolamine dehydratase